MSEAVPRRQFLGQVMVGGTALLASGPAGAETVEEMLRRRAQEWRRLWEQNTAEILDHVFAQRPGGRTEEERHQVDVVARSLGAFHVYKEFSTLSVAEQTHPAMQHLVRQALVAIGRGLVTSRKQVETYLQTDAELDPHLRVAIRGLRYTLRDWQSTVGRQQALEQRLTEMEEDPELRLHSEHHVKRIGRLELLSGQIAESPSALVESVDPVLEEQVRQGREQWTDQVYVGIESGEQVLLILALLGLGGVAVSGLVIGLTGVCVVACDSATAGILVILLGLALVGLAIWGIVAVVKRLSSPRPGPIETRPDGSPPLPYFRRGVPFTLQPLDGWFSTGIHRRTGETIRVQAHGLIRSPRGWGADADGNGVVAGPEARMPGAPEGALIGRIGARCFFLGSEGTVPEGVEGELELAINQTHGLGFVSALVQVD